jgi:hypothetical protein
MERPRVGAVALAPHQTIRILDEQRRGAVLPLVGEGIREPIK